MAAMYPRRRTKLRVGQKKRRNRQEAAGETTDYESVTCRSWVGRQTRTRRGTAGTIVDRSWASHSTKRPNNAATDAYGITTRRVPRITRASALVASQPPLYPGGNTTSYDYSLIFEEFGFPDNSNGPPIFAVGRFGSSLSTSHAVHKYLCSRCFGRLMAPDLFLIWHDQTILLESPNSLNVFRQSCRRNVA